MLKFEILEQEILGRRGDRVICERIQRAVVAHLRHNHWGRDLDTIRQVAPEDYELYKAVIK